MEPIFLSIFNTNKRTKSRWQKLLNKGIGENQTTVNAKFKLNENVNYHYHVTFPNIVFWLESIIVFILWWARYNTGV